MVWRNKKDWSGDGFEFSFSSDEALELFDELTFAFFTAKLFDTGCNQYYLTLLDKLTTTYPDFVMGGLLNVLVKKDLSVIDSIKTNLEENKYTKYEETHCKAVIALTENDNEKVCSIYAYHLLFYPKDLFGIRMGYFSHFYMGNFASLRDIIVRVIPHFEKTDPCYGYLLNLLAFGLEENNAFELADKTVKEGLELVPGDCMGIHAQAHIYESLCKYEEGIKFLEDTEDLWKNQFIGCHTYWHLCLFHVELGNYAKAIDIFDEKMKPKILQEKSYLGVADGVQLLYRLEFNDFNVGERWQDIYTASENLSVNHFCSFYLCHLILSMLRSTDRHDNRNYKGITEKLQTVLPDMSTHTQEIMSGVVLPVINAFVEHAKQNFKCAAEMMYPLKDKIVKLGGSNSQRDFFELFLIDSCLRSNEWSTAQIIGKQLLHERIFLKPGSTMTKRLIEKINRTLYLTR